MYLREVVCVCILDVTWLGYYLKPKYTTSIDKCASRRQCQCFDTTRIVSFRIYFIYSLASTHERDRLCWVVVVFNVQRHIRRETGVARCEVDIITTYTNMTRQIQCVVMNRWRVYRFLLDLYPTESLPGGGSIFSVGLYSLETERVCNHSRCSHQIN